MTTKGQIRSLRAQARSVLTNEGINTLGQMANLFAVGREAAALAKLDELVAYARRSGAFRQQAHTLIRDEALENWMTGRCRYAEAVAILESTGLDKWEAGEFIDNWQRPEGREA